MRLATAARGGTVGFVRRCGSDPLLELIHATYGATPLHSPDPRWAPLTLFSVADKRVRYLGSLLELDPAGEPPASRRMTLPALQGRQSSSISWSSAVDIVTPFLSALLGVALPDLRAALSLKVDRQAKVSLSIGRVTRRATSPLALARWLETAGMRLPAALAVEGPVFLVDSVVYGRELVTTVERSAEGGTTANIEASLAGSVEPRMLTRSESRVSVRGERDTPFALTSVKVERQPDGTLAGLRLSQDAGLRAGAMPGTTGPLPLRANIASSGEMIAFDA
jgi:hypothetical protein